MFDEFFCVAKKRARISDEFFIRDNGPIFNLGAKLNKNFL